MEYVVESPIDLQARISRFRTLHEQDPDARYFAPLADLLRQDGCYDEALGLIEKGLSSHADYTAGLVILGRTLQEVGRSQEAVQAWNQVLLLDGGNLLALEALALHGLDNGNWEKTIPILEQLCEQDGDDSPWSGLLIEARGHFRNSTKVDPTTTDSASEEGDSFDTMTLVDMYLAQGYRDRALDVLRRMLPGSGPEQNTIQERISELEADGNLLPSKDENKPPLDSDPSLGQEGKSLTAVGVFGERSGGRPLVAEAERAAREKERSERRASEQRRFEEWLQKIRFDGSQDS